MPSSVVEARYKLNIFSRRSRFILNMLITTIFMKARGDRRTMSREKETAIILACERQTFLLAHRR